MDSQTADHVDVLASRPSIRSRVASPGSSVASVASALPGIRARSAADMHWREAARSATRSPAAVADLLHRVFVDDVLSYPCGDRPDVGALMADALFATDVFPDTPGARPAHPPERSTSSGSCRLRRGVDSGTARRDRAFAMGIEAECMIDVNLVGGDALTTDVFLHIL